MSSSRRQIARPVVLGGPNPGYTAAVTWPQHDEREDQATLRVTRSGSWAYNGREQAAVEGRVAAELGMSHARFVTSGDIGLQAMYAATDLPFGTKIAVPATSFMATWSAAFRRNWVVIPVDVDANLVMSPTALEEAFRQHPDIEVVGSAAMYRNTPHYDHINAVCDRHGAVHLGDLAHTLIGALWQGEMDPEPVPIARKTKAAVGSAQGSKPSQCGEGGVVVTDDDALWTLLTEYVNNGRGHREHPMMGLNARPVEWAPAVYGVQLDRRAEQFAARHRVGLELDRQLSGVEGVRTLSAPRQLVERPQFHYVIELIGSAADQLTGPCVAWALDMQLPWGIRPVYRPFTDKLSGWNPLSDPAIAPQLIAANDPQQYVGTGQLARAEQAYQTCLVTEQDALLNDHSPALIAEELTRVLHYATEIRQAWEEAGRPALTH